MGWATHFKGIAHCFGGADRGSRQPVRCLPMFVGCLSLVLAMGRAHAEAVVVATSAPPLAVGQVVPDDVSIDVPGGAQVSFLTRSGTVVVLTGPYSGTVASAALDAQDSSLASLLPSRQRDSSSVGGSRALGDACRGGRAVSVDPVVTGRYCIGESSPVFLVRPDGQGRSTIILTDVDSGESTSVVWADGQLRTRWPAWIPLSDGRVVLTQQPSQRRVARLEFAIVPRNLGCEADDLVELAFRGCLAQFNDRIDGAQDRIAPLSVYLEAGAAAGQIQGQPSAVTAQTTREAWLYCYYQDPDVGVTPIFPGDRPDGAAVAGNRLIAVADAPGGRGFQLPRDAGPAEIRCFAVDEDVTRLLPPQWVDNGYRPLVGVPVGGVDGVFLTLPSATAVPARLPLSGR